MKKELLKKNKYSYRSFLHYAEKLIYSEIKMAFYPYEKIKTLSFEVEE